MRTVKQMLRGAPNVTRAALAKVAGVDAYRMTRWFKAALDGDFLSSLIVLEAAKRAAALAGGGLQTDLEDFMAPGDAGRAVEPIGARP